MSLIHGIQVKFNDFLREGPSVHFFEEGIYIFVTYEEVRWSIAMAMFAKNVRNDSHCTLSKIDSIADSLRRPS